MATSWLFLFSLDLLKLHLCLCVVHLWWISQINQFSSTPKAPKIKKKKNRLNIDGVSILSIKKWWLSNIKCQAEETVLWSSECRTWHRSFLSSSDMKPHAWELLLHLILRREWKYTSGTVQSSSVWRNKDVTLGFGFWNTNKTEAKPF